jgi:MoxR-like ATPase
MLDATVNLCGCWPQRDAIALQSIPGFVNEELAKTTKASEVYTGILPDDAVDQMVELARALWKSRSGIIQSEPSSRRAKRQKVDGKESPSSSFERDNWDQVSCLVKEVEDLARAYNALFEWSDGPLVKAVKAGDMILLDEISLAEDAVLERLNSVLEPSRTLVLAEKGSADDVESRVLIAHECFQLFATMNPGGDFGKRELSPALRSRFTEIWVPAVTDSADIDFVLERSLAQSAFEEGTRNDVKRKMIEYFNWFNEHLCTDPSRPYAELALSLRDILTWAAFITACTQAGDDLDIWGIYYHGACLMHLDGLGLGTALASHDSASAKNKAIEFLMEHVPVDKRSTLGVMTNGFNVLDAKFGCNTFRIPVGQDHVAEADFNLEAPTTSVNIFRILRAMQLSKPVLLEGSPGVGKTTLVAALAAASGHKLVRINLSDQTDISDLFGSDLPVPEKDASGNNSASFSWCDGVLLSAIKKGDWVLLDELNLASQAVLEGLNSCLDHRASVYIPELGSSFRCPASFRIFAAQNPLAQGGGRKGLPKSFLNRFTKVFVDSLTDDDLRVILTAKFPSLDEKLIDRVIAFNSRINCDVVQDRLYGQSGAPWEFNLRDVFRWCELLRFDLFGQISISLPLVLARDLYFQRFRAQHDREIAKERYLSIFGSVDQKDPRCKLATTPLEVLVGSVRLARLRGPDITRGPYVVESPLSLIHFQALEAVARCISKNWPCLLVGPAVVGKSSTIGCLAELTGRKLVEICLSPSSDVSELVGCFEQVDGLEDYRVAFASICRVAEEYLLLGGSETEKVCDLLNSIRSADDEVEGMRFAQHIASLLFTELRSRVDLNPIVWDDLAASRDLLLNYNGKMSTIGGHFVWKDGILIEAMEKGYWLHLKHVNLCPASVLDRLNSVMEPNGSLLLAECSSAGEDGGTRHRQVHCHPDFRIFLSMNPEYGEVSRAMRNRCVEIALMDHPALAYEGSYVDAINRLQRIGLRSQLLADTILKRCETSSLVESCGKVMCRLLLRGVTGFGSIASATEVMLGSIEKDHDPWLEKVDIEGASFDRILSFSDMKGQFLSNSMNTVSWEGRALEKFLCKRGTHSTFFPLIHSLGDHHMGISGPNFILLRNHMIALYLCKSTNLDISLRASFLDTFDGSLSGSLHFAANYMMRLLGGPNTTESKIRFPAEGRFDMQHFLSIAFNKVYFRRIPQTLVEQAWYQEQRKTIRSRSFEGSSELCALQVSFLLSTGQIDRSEVVCPVTPHLYPFFNVLDNLIDLIYQDPSNDFGVAPKIDDVLRDRDGLWNLTKNLAFSSSRVDFLCFDEIDFIVQWKWLCDSLQQMSKFVGSFATDNGQERRKLSALSDTIERELYYGGSVRISCSIAKRSNKPFVPKTTEGWNLNMQSRDLAEKCSIWSQRCEIAGERVGDELLLDDLVQHQHPALYVDSEMKEQILAVISMSYLATTGEAGDDGLTERRNLSRQALTAVQARLSVARKHFEQNINLVQMHGQIHTIDNMMSVDDLNALSDASDSVQQLAKTFSQRLMEKFAYMQIAPSAEYWCERQEQFLIRWFCKLLCQVEGDVYCDIQFLAEPIRKFLDVGLHQTFWNLADLRPYQTLLWSLEKKESRDPRWRKLLKNLLPVMTYNASIRVWSNCTVHLKGISQRIEFSNIKETCVLRGSKQSDPQEEALDDLDTLDVPTSTALSLVGGCFTVVHNEAKYLPFSTIENHQARVKQSEALVGIFTIVANGIADTFFPYELFYLFLETVHSLKNSFSSDDFVALNAILRNPTLWNSSQCGDLRRLLILSSNELFLDLVDPLVMPLFDLLRRSRSCQSSETTEYGEALIQLGLLRFHLLLPDSPLDPAREPEAKVRALKISKDRLKIERCAIQMDSGLQCGDFCPSHERTKEIDGQLDLIKALHSKHVDRIVSRPVDAPSFVGLYRETNEGARRFLSVAAVHALMHLRSSDFSSASSVQTIANWQSTTEAFCERILSTYAVFEDVVVPLIDCVAMVNRGLKLFFRPTRDSPSGKADLAVAFKFALTFPVSDYDSVFDSAHLMLRSVRLKSVNAHRELAISILSHLVSRRRVAGFDRRSLLLWNHVVRLVAEDETVDNASLPKSDEELEEIEFRRQFPDHSLDFQSLVQHSDEEERDRENLSNSESPAISTLFREEFKVILYSLHRDMFYAKTGMTDESDRVKSFRLQYGTAFLLHRAAAVENSNSLGAAGHIVALALATPSFKGTFVGEQSDYRRGHVYDFHKDPNPVEALKSCEPLLSLQARVSQLLTAFPGNEILLAIARVIDRLKRFDLSVVPLGKLLRGMELLLRQSQDWEQHASERVQLGDSLRSVSETVARWRKAELFSWSSLLTNREAQFQRNAHGHWYKLYRLFMIDPCDDTLGSAESTRINSLDRSTPAWLWKGVNFEGIRLTPAKTPFGTLSELVKALDTFILTSPLGEVGTRLGMIENFAMEKRAEYLHMSAGVECLHLARTLSSLWAYYHQFTAFFLTKISEKRRPLEKRLHEEAKLAKWDEQSYYALSESTEKNYRKLMRILREYDEVLHINVGVILEDELYKGIGQDTDTTRPTTSIPGEAELFPFCPGISKDQEVCICPKTWPAVDPKRSWTNVVGFAVPVEQRSILVSKYLTKMFKLHITERTNPESWGSMGAQEASHLSLSIFDRIQRLRSENTTRPMKERAVTDLLKELKRQGYASTKWSIPKEIQQVESIFQLPSLLSEQRGIGENELIYLQNAEEYYQKCLLEANRLRSEITMMGSRHLTQRQLDIFLSSGEHGLLLLAQQRGVLSSIIIDRRHLQVNVNTLSEVTSSLPTGQTYLNKMVKDLTMKIAASSECMAQTALVLRARSHLTSREDVRSWTRDRTVSMLDLGSRLVKRRIFGGPLVLDRLLVQIHETKTELRSALTLLEDCRYDCMRHGFLPVDSLDTCKKALDLAVEQAARCHEQVTLRDVENPLSFLPRFVEAHSQAVEAALFAVQAVVGNIDGQDVSPSIWDCHRSAIAEWSSVNTNRLSDRLFEVLNQLRLVHDINGLDHEQQQICVGLATDLSFLFAEAMRILDDRLVQFLRFHREAAKLHYVLLRIFRTLCAKGYCSDKTKDGEEEGEGEASGMTFEDDKDGTGMGEGEGKRDVTDEIENEEQLLGLKNEAQNEEKNSEEKGSKQLDEEEAEKGMEMEADFNGEMYDMPDPTPDVRDNDEEDTKEELDREMGEEGGANEEVIDEKMWNDSDNDEDQGDAQDEKLEKDSGVEGGAAGDELTTKDDTKGKEEKEAPQSGDSHKDQANDDPQEDETTAEMVNEDSDDRYEDNHGVNVRDEKLSDEKPDEQQMELDDNLELNDGSPEGNEGDQSSEETIEDVENDDALNKENDNPGNDVAADEQLSEENVEAEDLDTNAIRAENAIPDEVNDEEPEDDSNPDMQPPSQMAREPTDSNEGLGVRAQDGTDAVQDDTREDDDAGGDGKGEEEEVNGQDTQASEMEPSGAGGSSSGANQGQGLTNEGQNWDTSQPSDEIPNPLKNPGDATKYWHRRLNIVQPEGSNDELLEISDQLEQQKTNENAQGDFEYVGENQQGTTQALGEVEDTEAMDLDEIEAEVQGESVLEKEPQRTVTDEKSQEKRRSQTNKDRGPTATKDENAPNDNEDTMDEDGNDFVDRDEASGEYVNENDSEQHATGNQVMADLSQLQVQDDSVALEIYRDTIVEESVLTGASLADQDAARAQWSMIVGNTHSLSRRLCEKLRLVLEPLVASKLRGDYRTGKRINMKRVIGYVASGYRKDKIWLRRTKPAKRDYRILLAVDDSESMKAGAGDIALHALATLANGMGQLDVGELGVASFGNEMRLLHDFHQPFTAESGANVVRNFTFAQPRTRTALCVESALQALDAAGGNSSMQLVFLISDGRIERDSRETLRRLIREMMERNILLAMVIVESSANARSSSIVNMKEVSFENGKPKVKSFIEDYPFPYYIVLNDMQTLPEVLGDALRQWFEMLLRLQTKS